MSCPDERSLTPAQVVAGWLKHIYFRNPWVNTAADQKEDRNRLLQLQCGCMKDSQLTTIFSMRIPAPTTRQVVC